MSDTRVPLVTYVKNFGGVFQGEEDFRPCYLASEVDPVLEAVIKALDDAVEVAPTHCDDYEAISDSVEEWQRLLARLRACWRNP